MISVTEWSLLAFCAATKGIPIATTRAILSLIFSLSISFRFIFLLRRDQEIMFVSGLSLSIHEPFLGSLRSRSR